MIPPGQVLPEEVPTSEVMDESILNSSDREDGEHEAMSKEVGTPKVTALCALSHPQQELHTHI